MSPPSEDSGDDDLYSTQGSSGSPCSSSSCSGNGDPAPSERRRDRRLTNFDDHGRRLSGRRRDDGRRRAAGVVTCDQCDCLPTPTPRPTPRPTPKPTTLSPISFDPASFYPAQNQNGASPGIGCCRTADGGSGTKTDKFVSDIDACMSACLAESNPCVAFEYWVNNERCELHTATIAYSVSESCSEAFCYIRFGDDPVPTPTSPPLAYELVYDSGECKSSDKLLFEWLELDEGGELADCAASCVGDPGCSYFIYRRDQRKCYAEYPSNPTADNSYCEEGFDDDPFSFYRLIPASTGVTPSPPASPGESTTTTPRPTPKPTLGPTPKPKKNLTLS